MPFSHVIRSCSLVFAGLLLGCASTPASHPPGEVALRSDGSPEPEPCPEATLNAMKILGLTIGDAADVYLDLAHPVLGTVVLKEGPIVSIVSEQFGMLKSGTQLYGRVWTGGQQAVIRYYEAREPGEKRRLPICAVARSARGQLRKMPGSKPGTAIIEYGSSLVVTVSRFL